MVPSCRVGPGFFGCQVQTLTWEAFRYHLRAWTAEAVTRTPGDRGASCFGLVRFREQGEKRGLPATPCGSHGTESVLGHVRAWVALRVSCRAVSVFGLKSGPRCPFLQGASCTACRFRFAFFGEDACLSVHPNGLRPLQPHWAWSSHPSLVLCPTLCCQKCSSLPEAPRG